MGRHRDIEKIIKAVMEPMFEDIMSGGYKLEEATKDIGSHRTVFQISLQPTMMLKLGKNGSEYPQLN